jgi:hypothetical protein
MADLPTGATNPPSPPLAEAAELVVPHVVELPDQDHVLVIQLREPMSALEEQAIARNFRLLEPDRVNAILLHHRVELAVIPRQALRDLRLVASMEEDPDAPH